MLFRRCFGGSFKYDFSSMGSVTLNIRRLTPLQMRVLAALATKGGREVFSVDFLSSASVLNAASAKRAIDRLVTDGLVFNNAKEFRFVNPFFREWIKRMA